MDYEKKYKEALELARVAAFNGHQSLMEGIFPELAESKDEKTRKRIIALVNAHGQGIYKGDMLAWLEKQGEHANFRNKIQIGDKVTRNEDGVLVNLSQLNRVAKKDEKQAKQKLPIEKLPSEMKTIEESLGFTTQEECDGYNKMVSDLIMSDGDKGEQKPTDKVEPKFKVKYAGSEYNVFETKDIAGVTFYGIEDEPNHIDYVKAENCEIISVYAIKENGSTYPTKPAVFSEKKPKRMISAEAKEAMYDKPACAWSEKDENVLEDIKEAIINYWGGDTQDILLDWLKSIKDKYTWKPSEEQLEFLQKCIEAYNEVTFPTEVRVLSSLYNDLKKLTEE